MKWAIGIGLFLAGFLIGRLVPSPSDSPSIVETPPTKKKIALPHDIAPKGLIEPIKTHGSLPEKPSGSTPSAANPVPPTYGDQEPKTVPKRASEENTENTLPESWRLTDEGLNRIDTPAFKEEFLKRARVSNLFPYLQDSSSIKDTSQLENMNGTFRGRVVLDSKEQWRMTMNNRVYFEGTQVKGRSRIKLSRDGEVFSDADQKGKIENMKSHSASISYLLEAGPRSYFHLFYQRNQDRFIGNYYERQSPGVWAPKGMVTLRRR